MSRLLRACLTSELDGVDRLLLAIPLGQALLGTGFVVLALTGSLQPGPILLLLAAMAILGRTAPLADDLRSTCRTARAVAATLSPRAQAVLVMLLLPGVAAWSGCLLPPFGVDAPAYVHAATRWLLRPVPAVEASLLDHMTLNVEAVCALALVLRQTVLSGFLEGSGGGRLWDGAEVGAFVNGLVHLTALATLYRLGRDRRYARSTCLLAVAAFALAPVVAELPALLKNDAAMLALILLALRTGCRSIEQTSLRLALLSGICLGAAYGAKQLAIYAVAATGVLLLLLPALNRDTGRHRASRGSLALAGAWAIGLLTAALPWSLKNVWLSGSPIWPLPFLGGEDRPWSDWAVRQTQWELEHLYTVVNRHLTLGPLFETLGPAMQRIEPESGFGPLLLAGLPLTLAGRRRLFSAAPLLIWTGLFFLIWQVGPHYGRYLLPAIAALTLPAVHGLHLVARGGGLLGITARWSVAAWLISAGGMTLLMSLSWLPAVVGLESRQAFLARAVTAYDDQRTLRRVLPESARVLLVDELGPYYLGRETVLGSLRHQSNLDFDAVATATELERALRSLGVTHVYSMNPDNLDPSRAASEDERRFALLFRGLLNRLPLERSFPPVRSVTRRLVAVAARGRLYRLPAASRTAEPGGSNPAATAD